MDKIQQIYIRYLKESNKIRFYKSLPTTHECISEIFSHAENRDDVLITILRYHNLIYPFKEYFEQFLKQHNALTEFFENLNVNFARRALMLPRNTKTTLDKDDYFIFVPPHQFMYAAFWWRETTQGHDFWSCLCSEWGLFLRKKIFKKYLEDEKEEIFI